MHYFKKLLFDLIKSLWYLSITLLFCLKLKAYWKIMVYSLSLFSLSWSETRCSLRFSIILSSSILPVCSTGFSTVLFTALLILSHFPSFTITQCLLYCCMLWRLLRYAALLACYSKRHILYTENNLILKLTLSLLLFLPDDIKYNCDILFGHWLNASYLGFWQVNKILLFTHDLPTLLG